MQKLFIHPFDFYWQVKIISISSFHFFSLLKNSFLADILTDAKSINPAPMMDIHSAFLWLKWPTNDFVAHLAVALNKRGFRTNTFKSICDWLTLLNSIFD